MIVGEQTHMRNILMGKGPCADGRMRISRGGKQTFYQFYRLTIKLFDLIGLGQITVYTNIKLL